MFVLVACCFLLLRCVGQMGMVRHRLPLGACLYRLMCYFNRCDMETKTTNTLQPLNLSSILDTCLICTSSCRPRRCRFGLPWGLRAWGPVRVCCGVSRRLCVGGWAASLGGAVLLVGVLLRRPGAGGGPWRGGWGLSGRGARRVLFRCCFSFHCILRVKTEGVPQRSKKCPKKVF